MGKKNLLVMAASIFLATANAPTATAQEAGGVEISTTSMAHPINQGGLSI